MNESFKENFKPFIFVLIVLILTAITAHSQRKFGGTVTEVVDGKTCVVKLTSGQLTVVLQYVEIPEPEQPLHQTVKEHLEKLVLGKTIEFLPRGVTKDKTVGQLFVKGVDISQQMLRDGAAWYSIPEQSGQDEAQSLLYKDNETQARSEKRGVWSVENLKPSWEFRAEQAALEQKRREEAMRQSAFVSEMQSQRRKPAVKVNSQYNNESGFWGVNEDRPLPPGVQKIGGLYVSSDPMGRLSIVVTPNVRIEVSGGGAPQMMIGIGYLSAEDGARGMKNIYAVGIESTSEKFAFLKDNNLIITADRQKISIGRAKRFGRETEFGVKEILTYEINRSVIEKIANASNVQVKVGTYNGKINADIQKFLQNMLAMMR